MVQVLVMMLVLGRTPALRPPRTARPSSHLRSRQAVMFVVVVVVVININIRGTLLDIFLRQHYFKTQ